MPPASRGRSVEGELPHQLHDARRRERVLDPAERRGVRDVHGSRLDGEVRMVEYVEGLDPERQVALVVEVEVLAEPEVPVPVLRTAQDAHARIAERADGRVHEAFDVGPRVVDAGAADLPVADAVRP